MLFIYISIYNSTIKPVCFSVISGRVELAWQIWDFLGRPLRLLSGMGVREIGYLV
jgi:hypothetical protein